MKHNNVRISVFAALLFCLVATLVFAAQDETSTKDMAQFTPSGGIFFGIHVSNQGRVMIFSGGFR
jgi:hypothetical protein